MEEVAAVLNGTIRAGLEDAPNEQTKKLSCRSGSPALFPKILKSMTWKPVPGQQHWSEALWVILMDPEI